MGMKVMQPQNYLKVFEDYNLKYLWLVLNRPGLNFSWALCFTLRQVCKKMIYSNDKMKKKTVS